MNTQDLDELSLRRLQLVEIRAMLSLAPNATHQVVIKRLAEIGRANRIDLTAIPERYRYL